ncbi:MAG: hypothetical protein HGA76_08520, partial [Candidatus Firestonebacteria bacterium]|nr:hypothetical protein [Candidatus Firestonebacteria bacterium]
MQPLGINGMGLAGGVGLGLAQALENWRTPGRALSDHGSVPGRFVSALPVPALSGARRFSPWLKMSLAAAREAVGSE